MRSWLLVLCAALVACSSARAPADSPPAESTATLPPAEVITSAPAPSTTIVSAPPSGSAPAASPGAVLVQGVDPATAELVPLLELGRERIRGCSLAPPRALVRGCRPIAVKRATASAADSDAGKAADGSACSLWNAGGFGPTTLRLEFAEDLGVRAILVVPEQTPPVLEATHYFRLSLREGPRRTYKAHATLSTERPYVVVLPQAVPASSLEVVTPEMASWVAFREIMPLECDRAPGLPAALATALRATAPEFEVVQGDGVCASDADCVPASCCSSACSSRQLARACKPGAKCPGVTSAFDAGGRCACVEKRCATLVPQGPLPGGN